MKSENNFPQVTDILNQIDTQYDKLATVTESLKKLKIAETNNGVTLVLDSAGILIDLNFSNNIEAKSGDKLAEQILGLYQVALVKVLKARNEILSSYFTK